MLLTQVAATAAVHGIPFTSLHLDPVAVQLWKLPIRWYSLGYLAGILIGWWYLLKLLDRPGAPMGKRHADDMVFYATLGIILGGRLGYVLFYRPDFYFAHPLEIVKMWDGGMSFHGGVIGTSLGIFYLARKNGLSWLRIHDYVACCAPFGIFLVRLANFVNGELWGRPADVPWAVRFCENGDVHACVLGPGRHPSQLYEALLEGVLLFLVLAYAFWKTEARYQPGRLLGIFLLTYGLSRFFLEFFREADAQLMKFAAETHLHMGQWLSLPMILGGAYLVATAGGRRVRVEPTVGAESVA